MKLFKLTSFFVFIIFSGCASLGNKASQPGAMLNDVHSRLNATEVERIFVPRTTEEVAKVVRKAKKAGRALSISAGRHAMGGQQFGADTWHIRMNEMEDVLVFDRERGIVRVEAGITWPKLVQYLNETQAGSSKQWGIRQKQTGADYLSVGGALSANAHGRGLKYKPIIQDVESFMLVNADGQILNVSRTENAELFRLVIGGYGLFGVITTVDLRLGERVKLKRVVEVVALEQLIPKAQEQIAQGALYGDYQYKTDEAAADFMKTGVLSTYHPVPADTPLTDHAKALTGKDWAELLLLAHTNKQKAFEMYSRHYLSTHGQIYWSDSHQMSYYSDAYEEYLKKAMPDYKEGSLMITEVYVPRMRIQEFIEEVAEDARKDGFNIIYGTLRLIHKDDESFLAWAKDEYACTIFNLRVEHTEAGFEKAKHDFQKIIDRALAFNGSYYLTYHRWARKDQLLKAYPQFPEFLRLKLRYDPEERFQSDWYRHYKSMFAVKPQLSNSNEVSA